MTTALNPALRAAYGVGPDTAAQLLITAGTNAGRLRSEAAFAMLAGVGPHPGVLRENHPPPAVAEAGTVPRTTRCTASPWSAGPRSTHPRLRRPPTGRGPLQERRSCVCSNAPSPAKCSNTSPAPVPIDDYSDLRPTRQARNITLAGAAEHFDVWPNEISRLERGFKRDDTLAANYRQWLNTEIMDAA